MKVDCLWNDSVKHEFPDDWIFGGANGQHPGADPRYAPAVYVYFDENLNEVARRSSYTCREQALFFRSTIEAQYGKRVQWVQETLPSQKPQTIWSRA